MNPTFDTHILAITIDPDSFCPWMMWIDRATGEGILIAEMVPATGDNEPSPEDAKARELELEGKLGCSVEEGRELYKRSRANPDYEAVVQKYRAREREKHKRIIVEEKS